LARKILQPVNDYETLVNTVAEYSGKSRAAAKKIVRSWITGGYITKDGDKYVKTKSLN
jgi:hypothetical protein